jgi:hypothetical protein
VLDRLRHVEREGIDIDEVTATLQNRLDDVE